jgi:topoisomerase-4 subunit A
MEKYRDQLLRDITDDDILTLLEIKIKRISRFDLDKSKKEILDLEKKLRAVLRNLKRITEFTISYIESLLEKYSSLYPRRTKITSFEMVDRSEVTHETIKVFYDREKGYLGHKVKSEESVSCTPYDKILLFFKDGTYRVISVPEKIYLEKELLYFNLSDKETVFNCIYSAGGRDGKWYVKRFIIKSYILDKDYSLMSGPKDVLQYLSFEQDKYLTVYFKRKARMKVFHQDVYFEEYSVKGVEAKGNQISGKQVSWFKIKQLKTRDTQENSPDTAAKETSPDAAADIAAVDTAGDITAGSEDTPVNPDTGTDRT